MTHLMVSKGRNFSTKRKINF